MLGPSMIPQIHERKAHVFTYQYAQPEEYKHCLDSILLAEFVATQIQKITREFTALDLCAGCGVVGLELAHHKPEIENFDFNEVQAIFAPYFEKNLELTGKTNFRFLNCNYEAMIESHKSAYDLIVSNPPYFEKAEGKLSGNVVQDRARFFLDSSFAKLIASAVQMLKPQGKAFLLVKSGEAHGRDVLRFVQLSLLGSAKATILADIRGTYVLCLEKSL